MMIWPLIVLGIALIFFGAWSIDFAHLAYIQMSQGGDGKVGLPFLPGKDIRVTAGFWWNINFFVAMLGGNLLVIIGSLL